MDQSDTEFDCPISLDLYEELNPAEAERQGGLKSYTVKGDGGVIYYAGRKSDYTISVERLLCVDGWEDESQEKKQAMTLLVLKFVLGCTDPDGRFGSVTATIEFEDNDRKVVPEVEAWAPFRNMQRYNESQAELRRQMDAKLELGGGAAGATATIGVGMEKEISWKQSFFDEGHANAVLSDVDQRRNGVKWFLKQNKIQNLGVSPEFLIAILLKRASQAPYTAKFEIRAHAGTIYDFKDRIKRFFGAAPGRTKPFTLLPSDTPKTRYEGKEILENIDPNNLGKLKGKSELTELTVVWGYTPTS